MSKFKLMTFLIMVFSILGGMSSTNFLSFWFFLELNMMSFILILSISKDKNFFTNILIYFIPQAMASSMFLIMSLMSSTSSIQLTSIFLTLAMLMKMGLAPFHSWFLFFSKRVGYSMFTVASTAQKVLPLMVLFNYKEYTLQMFSILSLVVGSLGMIWQPKLQMFLAYYGVFSGGWIVISKTLTISFLYLAIFTIALSLAIGMIDSHSMTNNQSASLSMSSFFQNIFFVLFLTGIPPLVSFFPKLFILNEILMQHMILTYASMAMTTILSFWVVVNILNSIVMRPLKYLPISQKEGLTSYFMITLMASSVLVMIF